MSNRAVFTETLLEACRALGPVRVVLRNPTGLAEIFADLARLEIRGKWANMVLQRAHLHLNPAALVSVAFRTVESEAGEAVPAIWLYGVGGGAQLLLVLDQTHGLASREQRATYRQLEQEYGPFAHLLSREGTRCQPPEASAHSTASAAVH